MARTLRLTADDSEQADQLATLLDNLSQPAVRVGEEFFIAIDIAAEVSSSEVALLARLTEAGFSPQGLEPQRAAVHQKPKVAAPLQKRR